MKRMCADIFTVVGGTKKQKGEIVKQYDKK